MKILHISSEKSWRGGEQQIAYLIEETIRAGHECSLICRKASAFEKYCKEKNIKNWSVGFSGFNILFSAIYIRAHVKKHSYDIIHVHSAKSHLVIFISLLISLKVPVVLSRRVDFTPSLNWFTKWRYNHRGIKKIICVSHAIRKIMHNYLDKDKERCVTIHDGIDINKFSGQSNSIHDIYDIQPEKRVIVNTSALADHKDYYTFLDTAKFLLSYRSDIIFIIFGTGPMEYELKSYAENLGLKGNLIFAGFVNNIPQILPSADIFLMTSKKEGLGTSILDSFACKVPVVATRAGGIPEAVIDNETGLLADVGNVKELANNVNRLIDDASLREHITQEALIFLNKRFTKESMANDSIKMYEKVIS